MTAFNSACVRTQRPTDDMAHAKDHSVSRSGTAETRKDKRHSPLLSAKIMATQMPMADHMPHYPLRPQGGRRATHC